MTTLLARKAQVAGAVESVEGTAEVLAGSDVLLIYDVAFNPDVGSFVREPARASLSPLPSVRGVKMGSLSFRAEVKGSGNVANAPKWDPYLRACGFQRNPVETAPIGSVTSGPFEAGEALSFAPSGATARAVGDTADGAAVIRYVVLSGTPASGDTITGGTSGASATASGAPSTAQGFEYLPASDSIPSLTVAALIDGIRHRLVGARGTVTIDTVAGEPAFFNFSFEGVYLGTDDSALLTPTYDATVPPTFLGVGFTMDDDYQPCFTSLGVDLGNVLEARRCAKAENGAISVLLTGRSPTATIDPELDLVANFDFFGKLRSGDEGRFACEWGSTAGNVLILASPKVQIDQIGPGDRNGIAIGNLTFRLSTSTVDAGDDELQIAVV